MKTLGDITPTSSAEDCHEAALSYKPEKLVNPPALQTIVGNPNLKEETVRHLHSVFQGEVSKSKDAFETVNLRKEHVDLMEHANCPKDVHEDFANTNIAYAPNKTACTLYKKLDWHPKKIAEHEAKAIGTSVANGNNWEATGLGCPEFSLSELNNPDLGSEARLYHENNLIQSEMHTPQTLDAVIAKNISATARRVWGDRDIGKFISFQGQKLSAQQLDTIISNHSVDKSKWERTWSGLKYAKNLNPATAAMLADQEKVPDAFYKQANLPKEYIANIINNPSEQDKLTGKVAKFAGRTDLEPEQYAKIFQADSFSHYSLMYNEKCPREVKDQCFEKLKENQFDWSDVAHAPDKDQDGRSIYLNKMLDHAHAHTYVEGDKFKNKLEAIHEIAKAVLGVPQAIHPADFDRIYPVLDSKEKGNAFHENPKLIVPYMQQEMGEYGLVGKKPLAWFNTQAKMGKISQEDFRKATDIAYSTVMKENEEGTATPVAHISQFLKYDIGQNRLDSVQQALVDRYDEHGGSDVVDEIILGAEQGHKKLLNFVLAKKDTHGHWAHDVMRHGTPEAAKTVATHLLGGGNPLDTEAGRNMFQYSKDDDISTYFHQKNSDVSLFHELPKEKKESVFTRMGAQAIQNVFKDGGLDQFHGTYNGAVFTAKGIPLDDRINYYNGTVVPDADLPYFGSEMSREVLTYDLKTPNSDAQSKLVQNLNEDDLKQVLKARPSLKQYIRPDEFSEDFKDFLFSEVSPTDYSHYYIGRRNRKIHDLLSKIDPLRPPPNLTQLVDEANRLKVGMVEDFVQKIKREAVMEGVSEVPADASARRAAASTLFHNLNESATFNSVISSDTQKYFGDMAQHCSGKSLANLAESGLAHPESIVNRFNQLDAKHFVSAMIHLPYNSKYRKMMGHKLGSFVYPKENLGSVADLVNQFTKTENEDVYRDFIAGNLKSMQDAKDIFSGLNSIPQNQLKVLGEDEIFNKIIQADALSTVLYHMGANHISDSKAFTDKAMNWAKSNIAISPDLAKHTMRSVAYLGNENAYREGIQMRAYEGQDCLLPLVNSNLQYSPNVRALTQMALTSHPDADGAAFFEAATNTTNPDFIYACGDVLSVGGNEIDSKILYNSLASNKYGELVKHFTEKDPEYAINLIKKLGLPHSYNKDSIVGKLLTTDMVKAMPEGKVSTEAIRSLIGAGKCTKEDVDFFTERDPEMIAPTLSNQAYTPEQLTKYVRKVAKTRGGDKIGSFGVNASKIPKVLKTLAAEMSDPQVAQATAYLADAEESYNGDEALPFILEAYRNTTDAYTKKEIGVVLYNVGYRSKTKWFDAYKELEASRSEGSYVEKCKNNVVTPEQADQLTYGETYPFKKLPDSYMAKVPWTDKDFLEDGAGELAGWFNKFSADKAAKQFLDLFNNIPSALDVARQVSPEILKASPELTGKLLKTVSHADGNLTFERHLVDSGIDVARSEHSDSLASQIIGKVSKGADAEEEKLLEMAIKNCKTDLDDAKAVHENLGIGFLQDFTSSKHTTKAAFSYAIGWGDPEKMGPAARSPHCPENVARELYKKGPQSEQFGPGTKIAPIFLNPAYGHKFFKERTIVSAESVLANLSPNTPAETKHFAYNQKFDYLKQALDSVDDKGTHWRDFKKALPALSENPVVKNLFRENKDIVTKDAVLKQMHQEDAGEYHISYTTWDGMQRHNANTNLVVQMNVGDKMNDKINKDPRLTDFFRGILEASSMRQGDHIGGHPTTPYSIGWIRVDVQSDPDAWVVEELQSDFGRYLENQTKSVREKGHNSFKLGGQSYSIDEMLRYNQQIAEMSKDWYRAAYEGVEKLAQDSGKKKIFVHSLPFRASLSGWSEKEEGSSLGELYYDQMPKERGYEKVPYSDIKNHAPAKAKNYAKYKGKMEPISHSWVKHFTKDK